MLSNFNDTRYTVCVILHAKIVYGQSIVLNSNIANLLCHSVASALDGTVYAVAVELRQYNSGSQM